MWSESLKVVKFLVDLKCDKEFQKISKVRDQKVWMITIRLGLARDRVSWRRTNLSDSPKMRSVKILLESDINWDR